MGATYTRQSSSAIVDGGIIEAADINAEFNQILAAFAVSSGHTHDGTAAEGGPITKLLGTAITIGDATAGTDIAVTFDGETADGVLTWMEDEDYFKFSDDILINSTERLNFGDTGTYIFQSTDGQLDIVADTEVQIAATTIDINGAVALNGAITGATNITLSGELDAATLDISGDADIDGTLEADAITINGTTLAETISDTVGAMVTSNTESGITVAYDDADNTLDFTVGTLNQDTTGNAATATALATARTIHGVSFDGTANIDLSEVISDTVGAMVTSNTESGITVAYDDADNTLDFTVGTLNQDTTGNAATATVLETARTIGGTSFNGSANIAVALAATSTALATARTIGGTSFDGTANIAVNLAATATALETARTIAGQSFDGSANITIASTDLSNTSNITLNDGTQTLTNKTLTSPKINEDVAVTSTATELNILDGVTSTAAELNALDGITAVVGELNALDLGATAVGTAIASKAVILDSNKDYTGIRNFTISGEIDAATGDFSGDVDVDGTLEADAITINGTAIASVLSPVAGGSSIVTTGALNSGSITSGFGAINNGASAITTTGVGTFGSLDISGAIDVDGTSNLDVVDIDGAVDMASTLAVAGVVTANAGVVVDNITIDGTEIDLSSGNLLVDVAGDITFDAAGGDFDYHVNGTEILKIAGDSSNVIIKSTVSDKDITIQGNDGGSAINACVFDMSAAGAATFNNDVTAFSDKRLKDNVETIPNALDKVCAMRGVNFTRNDNNNQPGTGVIAQEMQEVFPVVVKKNNDELNTLSVSYGNLVGILIEAIKELKDKVEKLEGEK